MASKEAGAIEILFLRPRLEGEGSLVLTIPKYVVHRLRIARGSRLDLILYDSFVILRQREEIDYKREPSPKILELLDRVFGLFKQEEELEKKRYDEESLNLTEFDSRMKEIHNILKDTSSKILGLLKEKKWHPEVLTFLGELQDVEELLDALRDIYEQHYKGKD